jgi:hypothetical protein
LCHLAGIGDGIAVHGLSTMAGTALLGITYSEFDNKVGTQLKYCYPKDVLSKEAFETYSDYVIVSNQLCEKLIVVTFDEVQFMNYSVAIDNIKYERNALLFAFGFVLKRGVNTEPYSVALKRISATFVDLEMESEYLLSSKEKLQDFLKALYTQLNSRNEAFIELQPSTYLALSLFRRYAICHTRSYILCPISYVLSPMSYVLCPMSYVLRQLCILT